MSYSHLFVPEESLSGHLYNKTKQENNSQPICTRSLWAVIFLPQQLFILMWPRSDWCVGAVLHSWSPSPPPCCPLFLPFRHVLGRCVPPGVDCFFCFYLFIISIIWGSSFVRPQGGARVSQQRQISSKRSFGFKERRNKENTMVYLFMFIYFFGY